MIVLKMFSLLLIVGISVNEAVIIDCTYSIIRVWTVPNLYACQGKLISIGDPNNVTAVSHNHINGKSNNEVQALILDNSQIKSMLRNINQFYPNLESLTVRYSDITELNLEDLQDFPNLTQIDFGSNKIERLNWNLFKKTPKVKVIGLNWNPIKYIAHNVFDDLSELEMLHMNQRCFDRNINNNKSAIAAALFDIFQKCPPTLEMMKSEIVNGEELRKEIKAEIDEEINPLTWSVFEMGSKLIHYEAKITQNENQIQYLNNEIKILKLHLQSLMRFQEMLTKQKFP
ncbi:CLUMA_CG011688, isoform A [Clunio marinus]|uniref:CLUMA_CG011688, isoform A n=1 Tax=Clunio marinus TaxID=568069 RepID=A0A1J1IH14_9DIPT|nr:CLUMA_CG011688, isoform A [Clunio marinus]